MFQEKPQIESTVDAIDELNEVKHAMRGMDTFMLALVEYGSSDDSAILLASSLCRYCAQVTEAAGDFLYEKRVADYLDAKIVSFPGSAA